MTREDQAPQMEVRWPPPERVHRNLERSRPEKPPRLADPVGNHPRNSKARRSELAAGRSVTQLLLAALENHDLTTNDVQLFSLLPSDAQVAYSSGSIDAWSNWEPYVSEEAVLFGARRDITGQGSRRV